MNNPEKHWVHKTQNEDKQTKYNTEIYLMQSMGKNIIANFFEIQVLFYSHGVYIEYIYGY